MANTTAVYARIDTELKNNAEEILGKLGITPTSAIQMLYSQVVLQQALPFEPKLPQKGPIALGSLTHEQLDAVLQEAMNQIERGELLSEEEVDAIFEGSAKELDRDFTNAQLGLKASDASCAGEGL